MTSLCLLGVGLVAWFSGSGRTAAPAAAIDAVQRAGRIGSPAAVRHNRTVTVLVLGLVVFLGIHSVSIVAPAWRDGAGRARRGAAWKGVFRSSPPSASP